MVVEHEKADAKSLFVVFPLKRYLLSGSMQLHATWVGYSSGQRGQTVNLLA